MPRRCARAASLRPSTPIRGRRGYSDHVSEADPANGAASMRSSFLTPRWREPDSNSRSRRTGRPFRGAPKWILQAFNPAWRLPHCAWAGSPIMRGLAGAELRATSPDRVIEAQISLTEVVICDIGRISQLLSNLVANALAYGHVMLRSKCEAGYSRMSLKYSFPIRVIRYPKSRLSICSSRSFAEPISPARAG
jgi:hypothetical protein